jgi:hypothetical protein
MADFLPPYGGSYDPKVYHKYKVAAGVTTGRSAKNRRKMNQQPANSNA